MVCVCFPETKIVFILKFSVKSHKKFHKYFYISKILNIIFIDISGVNTKYVISVSEGNDYHIYEKG